MLVVPIGIYLILIIIRDVFYEKKVVYSLKWFFQVALYGLINIIILLPLLLPYMERKISPSFEHFKQISSSIPTIKSHLFSQQGGLIWDFLSKTGQNYEAWWNHQIFAGGIATICFLICIYWLLSKAIKTNFRLNNFSTPVILILTGILTFFLYIHPI
jgi:hypothetical protein